MVLGYSLWKTRYAADPAIGGKSIEVARHPLTVIGVAPQGFAGAMPGLRQDLWVTLDPLGTDAWRRTHRSGGAVWLNVVGRLRPGVSRDQAAQDLDTLMQHIVAAYPDDHLGENRITLDPMWRSPFGANGYMAATLPILLAFAAVVLLLTCANVATLTLVRFVSRRRELAIRQSLGANRMQLVRQMVLEGAMLSIVAGVVALVLTSWTSKTFAWFFPASSNPGVLNGAMDSKVIIGIAVFSLLSGMLCGALPAWRSSHAPALEVLKAESASISGGSRNRKLLNGLVVAQIALSLPLLLCSGLFLRTLRNLASANPGFEQDHILTASVGANIVGYSHDEEHVIRHKILDRVSALPGVKVATLTDWIPMTLSHKGMMRIRKDMCHTPMNLCRCTTPRWPRGISNPFRYPFWKDASLRRMTMKRPQGYSSSIRPRRGATGQGRIHWERNSWCGADLSQSSAWRRIRHICS